MRLHSGRRFWHLPLIVSALLALLTHDGCKQEPPPKPAPAPVAAKRPRPWGVLCSNARDGLELKKLASMQGDTVWEGWSISTGWLVEPIVIAVPAQGTTNAVAAAQFLIDRYTPVALILTGISESINRAHQIGDLVIPDRWVNLDSSSGGKEGPHVAAASIGRSTLPIDTALARMMGRAADAAAFRLRTIAGRLPEIHKGGVGISGNTAVASKAKREQLRKQLSAEISDTESAAVVRTATAAGVPIVVLRACAAPAGESDSPDHRRALESLFDNSGRNTALVLRALFESIPEGFLRTPGK